MDFFSALSLNPPKAHLVVRGELDRLASHQLRDRLDEAVNSGCISFTLDASAVTFLDAGGIGLLVRLRNDLAPYDGSVAVTAASRRFRQVVDLTGLGAVFGLDQLPDELTRRPTEATIWQAAQ